MMWLRTILFISWASLASLIQAQTPAYTVDSVDGGKTPMHHEFASINKFAKIHRVFWVISNGNGPAQLVEVGLEPKWKDEGFWYQAKGEVKAVKHLSALQVTFLTFDAFNSYLDFYVGNEIIDLEPNKTFPCKRFGRIPTNWNELHGFYQVVSFISKIRLPSGEVWEQDMDEIFELAVLFFF